MQRMTSVVAAMGLAMLAGCQPKAETAEQAQARMDTESAAAKTIIDSIVVEFAKHFNLGHGDVVAEFYAEQGHVMAPNAPVAVGREAIKATLATFFAMKPELKITSEAVVANGPLAIERGVYSLTFTPPGAKAPMTDTGKYLVHWHKVGDKWMLVDDIWNSDLPMMPMGPPMKM